MSEVWVVISMTDMSDFVDQYGESAGEVSIKIEGVYSDRNKAYDKKEELEKFDRDFVEKYECDPTEYDVERWDVK